MTGSVAVSGRPRMDRTRSSPSMPGIRRSATTQPTGSAPIVSRAALPLSASIVRSPTSCSARATRASWSGSSSTMRTAGPPGSRGAAVRPGSVTAPRARRYRAGAQQPRLTALGLHGALNGPQRWCGRRQLLHPGRPCDEELVPSRAVVRVSRLRSAPAGMRSAVVVPGRRWVRAGAGGRDGPRSRTRWSGRGPCVARP